MPDWMINIGNWIQNHLYLFMLMVVGVFLIISYFIARHKIKKEKEILEKNKEVDNVHEVVYEMLAHPFLRGQSHVFSTQKVENLAFFTPLGDFYGVWR